MLTDKQIAWDKAKALSQAQQKALRKGFRCVPIRLQHTRGHRDHDCMHTRKHHKASGRCRTNCDCTAGKRWADHNDA